MGATSMRVVPSIVFTAVRRRRQEISCHAARPVDGIEYICRYGGSIQMPARCIPTMELAESGCMARVVRPTVKTDARGHVLQRVQCSALNQLARVNPAAPPLPSPLSVTFVIPSTSQCYAETIFCAHQTFTYNTYIQFCYRVQSPRKVKKTVI